MKKTMLLFTQVSRMFARIGGLLILLSAGLVTLDVLFRSTFKIAVFESFELTSYAFAIATMFGMAWALVSKAHIRIEVVYMVMPPKVRAVMDVVALGLLAAVSLTLTYWAIQVVWGSIELDAHSNSTLAVPLVIPQGLWLIGICWFALCTTVFFGMALYGLAKGHIDQVQNAFGLASVQEEVQASVETPTDLTNSGVSKPC